MNGADNLVNHWSNEPQPRSWSNFVYMNDATDDLSAQLDPADPSLSHSNDPFRSRIFPLSTMQMGDRLMTILMNPFMSCGARLPIFALFVAAFFPKNGQNIVFLLYVLGILAAIFTGLVMKHTLFRGEAAPFVMELPPIISPLSRVF